MSSINYNRKRNKENEKESSIIENKSKVAFLSHGINSISQISKNSIFDKNQIIKQKDSFNEKNVENNENRKIKLNPLYYQFFPNNKYTNLYNLAISFYKKKMDIIYLFHVILVFEKLVKLENIKNNKKTIIYLKDFEFS